MSTIKERVERSLDALEAGRPLVRLVDEIVREFPDPYVLATQHAQRIVLKHTGKPIDPRFIWWHQFGTASTSSRSFTGWQHSGPPLKSMTLTELVIKRFDAHFQEAPDELDLYGGFYQQGRQANHFDERNEVAMLGSKVQEDLWALDFAVALRGEITRFWDTCSQHFRILAKVNLLGQGSIAARAGRISATDWTSLRAMVADGLAEGVLPTLTMLSEDSSTAPWSVFRYVLDRGDRGCLYSFVAGNGRTLLYRPWSSEAFRSFASEQDLAAWLRGELQDPDTLAEYVTAAHTDARDPSREHSVKTHLQSIANSSTDGAALALLGFLKRPIGIDLFTYLTNKASSEMSENATAMLDNAQLRKAMWSGYLSAFIKVFGGFAPLGWPMTLMLLGASLGKVGLDIDAAVHATDEQGRKSALRDAMLDSLFAALNMADLGFQSSFASLSQDVPFDEAQGKLDQWQVSQSAIPLVEGRETNELLSGAQVTSGRLRGIRLGSDGSCWIVLNGVSYRVRYDNDLHTWLVVPEHNPFAFGPLYPVRLNETNEWELLVPPRLVGGMPPAAGGMSSIRSRFWDLHLMVDDVRSKVFSANALRRQKALLQTHPIPVLEQDQVPGVDANGLDCVLVDGRLQYSYRYGREYYNSLIEYYTSDESKVNDVFRSGTYRYDDEDDYIQALADTLDELPESNEVNLYRGGHGSRGTSGQHYRNGQLRVGDVLVNTDLTSFTENPYKVAEFASQPSVNAPGHLAGMFDDTSVVFELPLGRYQEGTPISAFSLYWDEGETLFLPGHYFRIDNLEQVYGDHYRFVHVTLQQVPKPAAGPVFDLRTGLLFDEQAYKARFRTPELAERFFPVDPPAAAAN